MNAGSELDGTIVVVGSVTVAVPGPERYVVVVAPPAENVSVAVPPTTVVSVSVAADVTDAGAGSEGVTWCWFVVRVD